MGRGIERRSIEENVCDWIDLEDRVVGMFVPGDQNDWLGVTTGVLADLFSGAFQGLT